MTNKNLQPTTYNLQPKKGFVMLFSVLVSSLLVAIGLSIFNLTLKEITLSTAGRESQIAFYAANSGMECALYWDLVGNGSRSAFASSNTDLNYSVVNALCNGKRVNVAGVDVTVNTAPNSATTNFKKLYISDAGDNFPCVNVTVKKETVVAVKTTETTTIESQGNNTCAGGRRVQRGLKSTMTREL